MSCFKKPVQLLVSTTNRYLQSVYGKHNLSNTLIQTPKKSKNKYCDFNRVVILIMVIYYFKPLSFHVMRLNLNYFNDKFGM